MSHKRGQKAWLDSLPPVSEESIQRVKLRVARLLLLRTLDRIIDDRYALLWRAMMSDLAELEAEGY
jgi:hypothetical protein